MRLGCGLLIVVLCYAAMLCVLRKFFHAVPALGLVCYAVCEEVVLVCYVCHKVMLLCCLPLGHSFVLHLLKSYSLMLSVLRTLLCCDFAVCREWLYCYSMDVWTGKTEDQSRSL